MNTIKYTKKAWKKMNDLVDRYDCEVAWHGVCEELENGDIEVQDILVYPQVVSAATVEMDDSYGEWLDGLDDDTFRKLRLQGHSHVRMPVFPSTTDKEHQNNIASRLKAGQYYVFNIRNKFGDTKTWIYRG